MPEVVLTGDPWLDGVLWSRAMPLNGSVARLHVREYSDGLFRRLAESIDRLGLTFSVIADEESGDPVYWTISGEALGQTPFRNMPRAIGGRRVEGTESDLFLQGFLVARLILAQRTLRLSWAQDDLPAVLAPRGFDLRGAAGQWRLTAASRAHPLLSEFNDWIDAMFERVASEDASLEEAGAARADSKERSITCSPFLSRVFWDIVERPAIGSQLWDRYREDPDCPYTHHTQFLGDLARLLTDEDHPLPVVRTRMRDRDGSILMAVPPIYHVSGAVSDRELEIETIFQVPELHAETTDGFLSTFAKDSKSAAERLRWMLTQLRLTGMSPAIESELESLLERKQRRQRVWDIADGQLLSEVAGALLAVTATSSVSPMIVVPEELLASEGYVAFLNWIVDESGTIEAPRCPPDLARRGVIVKRLRAVRVLPPAPVLESASMLLRRDLVPSMATLRALGLLARRIPEIRPFLEDWCGQNQVSVPEHSTESSKRIVETLIGLEESQPAFTPKRLHPGSPQTLLPIDWSTADFRGSGQQNRRSRGA